MKGKGFIHQAVGLEKFQVVVLFKETIKMNPIMLVYTSSPCIETIHRQNHTNASVLSSRIQLFTCWASCLVNLLLMFSFHSGDPAEFFKDRNIVVNELIRKV